MWPCSMTWQKSSSSIPPEIAKRFMPADEVPASSQQASSLKPPRCVTLGRTKAREARVSLKDCYIKDDGDERDDGDDCDDDKEHGDRYCSGDIDDGEDDDYY